MVYQIQIAELLCKMCHLEYHLIFLLEAIIGSCSYPLYYLHLDYKVGLFLCENLDQEILIWFHFLSFSAISEKISSYKRTQP